MTVCVHAACISAPRGEGNEEHESALWACGAHRQNCGLARRAASHAHDAHTVYTSKKLVRNLGPFAPHHPIRVFEPRSQSVATTWRRRAR